MHNKPVTISMAWLNVLRNKTYPKIFSCYQVTSRGVKKIHNSPRWHKGVTGGWGNFPSLTMFELGGLPSFSFDTVCIGDSV